MTAAAALSSRDDATLPRWRRALPWAALVALLVIAQTLLVLLTINHENTRAQDQAESAAGAAAADIKQAVTVDLQGLQALLWHDLSATRWHAEAQPLLRDRRELLRIERRDAAMRLVAASDTPYRPPLFAQIARADIESELQAACGTALRQMGPIASRSYFVPLGAGMGIEVIDLCLPLQHGGEHFGFVTATLSLGTLLEQTLEAPLLRRAEISFVEADGTRLVRAGRVRGAGVYVAERLVDLPGQTLTLKLDSAAGRPGLIPTLDLALVLGLSLALGALVLALVRDARRRSAVERALAESLALRRAMEDSLPTGLRARDMQGRITYVNPAFCRMVGFRAEEMLGSNRPPYWPPEMADEYSRRHAVRLAGGALPDVREGYESTFVRRSGERFPVLIFEAPLVDGRGRQTGWMSALLDISDQRRIEELSRQQQDRLQATARLATVGEMASLLSHELNQPLAAIASYANGSLNLMADEHDAAANTSLLRQAAQRIAEQAERAGRVIKSVHDFVRRREQSREPIAVAALIDAVMPLARLQARKSRSRIEVEIEPGLPSVVCDRTMVEQVLLNLTRNGLQAMEDLPASEPRELRIAVRRGEGRFVTFAVLDRGHGVPPEVAQRLFTPFFTTRSEGMGLGLSLCRTVVEQHGGALDHRTVELADGTRATEFRFTLPADLRSGAAESAAAPADPARASA